MKNPICAASYERAVELMAAGCPLDYPDALPHQSFSAEQLPGYVESRVYKLGPLDAGWVIPLRLRTDRRSGTIISDLDFEPPWKGHAVDWECEPEEIIPKKHLDEYRSLVNSRLMKVLNEGCLIRRGYPVEGLLCGRSYQPIGESYQGFLSAKLSFTDNRGNMVPLCINLSVYTHSCASASQLLSGEAGQRPSRRRRIPRLTQQAPMSGSERESGRPPDFAWVSRDRDSDSALS
jgi:hypothetical protein